MPPYERLDIQPVQLTGSIASDILAKLQAIEQRLNDPFLTQLTGRYVELGAAWFAMSAGVETSRFSLTDVSSFSAIQLQAMGGGTITAYAEFESENKVSGSDTPFKKRVPITFGGSPSKSLSGMSTAETSDFIPVLGSKVTIKITNSGNNNVGLLLTGIRSGVSNSKQEVVNVFSRSLRTSSQNTNIMRPAGAKGCIIYLTVYGVTGTFGADQGVRLRAQLQGIKGYSFGDIYTAPQTMSNRSQIIMLYPGATDANVPAAVGGSRVIAPMFAPPRISLSIVVTGTFDVGQGIDCEADIEWLYG